MTPNRFRKLALGLPETSESEHRNHPDFRVRGKIFATLGPKEEWGMVNLTPDHQASLIRDEPSVFEAFNGAWGRQGATRVRLENAVESTVRQALIAAWRKTAPKTLVQEYDERNS